MRATCGVGRGTPADERVSGQVLTEYFKELEEESIRDNFVIMYVSQALGRDRSE